MSGTVAIVLIVLVWLLLLLPWLLRDQKPIRKAGEAFDETRVVFEGGSSTLTPRRRPKLAPPKAAEAVDEVDAVSEDELADDALADDVLIEDDAASAKISSVFAAAAEKIQAKKAGSAETDADAAVDADEPIVDGELILALESEASEGADSDVITLDPFDEDEPYQVNDAYQTPADLMYPDVEDAEAVQDAADVEDEALEPAEASQAAGMDDEDELSDDERAFAAARRGRGGYDPDADALFTQTRYQRRRVMLGVFAALCLVTLIVAVIVQSWAWVAFGVAVALTVFYLVALRRQVQAEQRLRRRRIQHLRRARLGVRTAEDEQLGIPQRLRHPGAVVLEIDDDSPDFAELDYVDAPIHVLPEDPTHRQVS